MSSSTNEVRFIDLTEVDGRGSERQVENPPRRARHKSTSAQMQREIVKVQAMLVEVLEKLDKQNMILTQVEKRVMMIPRRQDLSGVTFGPIGDAVLGLAGSTTDDDCIREGDSIQAGVTGAVLAAEQIADKLDAEQAAPAADQPPDKSDANIAAPTAEKTQTEGQGGTDQMQSGTGPADAPRTGAVPTPIDSSPTDAAPIDAVHNNDNPRAEQHVRVAEDNDAPVVESGCHLRLRNKRPIQKDSAVQHTKKRVRNC